MHGEGESPLSAFMVRLPSMRVKMGTACRAPTKAPGVATHFGKTGCHENQQHLKFSGKNKLFWNTLTGN